MLTPQNTGLIGQFPTKTETDWTILYDGLGTFWTQVFQEKLTVQGYTMGQSQEVIQAYLNTIEVINSYSAGDIPVFNQTLWYALIIKKSELLAYPFIYNPDDVVYGAQPSTNLYYAGETFQFGKGKPGYQNAMVFTPPAEFKGAAILANKILAPSVVYTGGSDFFYQAGKIYFNINPFDNDKIAKSDIVNANGEIQYYTDANGNSVPDQQIILWGYSSKIDKQYIQESFGRVFYLQQDSSQFYKDILSACMKIFVNTPTVDAICSLLGSFVGAPVCREAAETVQEFFEDDSYKIVVTDANVYKFDKDYSFVTGLAVGKTYQAGDVFIDELAYYDNVTKPNWWRSKLGKYLAVSQYLFAGTYQNQLVFKNDVALLTVDYDGHVTFPVEGLPADVTTFHNQLDETKIKEVFDLDPGGVAVINPVDFLFTNFMQYNTAMIYFNIRTNSQFIRFLDFMYLLQPHLPKHIYFITSINLENEIEEYDQLNQNLTIEYPTGDRLLNCDGSDSDGFIDADLPQAVLDDPSDPVVFMKNKLLSRAKSPELTQVEVQVGNGLSGGDAQVVPGLLFTTVPSPASFSGVRNLLLIDYS